MFCFSARQTTVALTATLLAIGLVCENTACQPPAPSGVGYSHSPAVISAAASAHASARASSSAPVTDMRVVSALSQITQTSFKADLKRVSVPRNVYRGASGLKDVRSYVEREFKEAGFAVSLQQVPFTKKAEELSVPPPEEIVNIVAEKVGAEPETVVMLTAHYDAVIDSPGADDDGTGVAALLAFARAASKIYTRSTVRIAVFTLEEEGLLGSRHYASSLSSQEASRIKGVFNLEMLGFKTTKPNSQKYPEGVELLSGDRQLPSTGDFIGVIGRTSDEPLIEALKKGQRYAPTLRFESLAVPTYAVMMAPDLLRSDHAPFWLAGVPAVMIGDTADFRSPHYHQSTDTVDTIDIEFATTNARWVSATALEFAGAY